MTKLQGTHKYGKTKSLIFGITLIYLLVLMLFIFTYYLSLYFNEPYSNFTRDPLAVMNTHPFVGFLSNIGIIFWTIAMTVCLFSSIILWTKTQREQSLFYFFSGLITAILLIDDLFMVHDRLLPIYLHITEIPLFIVYGIMIVGYLYYFRKQIFKTNYLVLGLAFIFFAFSLGVDHFDVESEFIHFFEDGPKLLGITTWAIYYTYISLSTLSDYSHSKLSTSS